MRSARPSPSGDGQTMKSRLHYIHAGKSHLGKLDGD
jgi:hypothetical protein